MPEEIKIRIGTVYDGTGAKQAISDQEKMRAMASEASTGAVGGAAGAGSQAIAEAEQKLRALKDEADKYNSMGATAAGAGAMRKYNLAVKEDRRLQGEIVASSQSEAQAMRGAGTPDIALEREVDLRKESLKVQKEMNVYESQAIPIAQQRLDAKAKAGEKPGAPAPAAPAAAPGVVAEQMSEELVQKRVEGEKKITDEHRKRSLMGGGGGLGGFQQIGGSALRGFDNASGMPLGGMISGLANPAVLAAVLAGSVVGKFAKDAMNAHDYHAQQQEIHDFDMHRLSQFHDGSFGDNQIDRSQGAAAMRKKAKQELDDAKAELNTAHRKGFGDMLIGAGQDLNKKIPGIGIVSPLIGATAHMETSVDKANREAKERLARAEADMAAKDKEANEQAMKGPAGLEMERIKAKLSGNQQAAREADFKRFMMEKESEGNALGLTGTFNDDYVESAAKEKLRDQYMHAGARLVNARSGNADVLRASQIATGQFGGGEGRLEKLIAEQTHHINANHAEAKQHMPKTFGLIPNLRGQL